jgi:hypothetical protein
LTPAAALLPQERTNVFWAPGSSAIVGKVQKRLGALVLEEAPLTSLSDQQAWPIWNKVSVVCFLFFVFLFGRCPRPTKGQPNVCA